MVKSIESDRLRCVSNHYVLSKAVAALPISGDPKQKRFQAHLGILTRNHDLVARARFGAILEVF